MRSLRAVLVVFLFASSAHAQDGLFTPQHVAKMRIVTSAVIAPDGTQVAYLLSVPRNLPKEKDGGSWSELHVVDTKGNSTPFITGQVNIDNIAWTPDGKSIAFLTKRDKDEHKSLYVIGARGGEARKLLTHTTDIQGYSFNGDGTAVAFLATESTPAAKKKQQDQGFNQEIYEEDQPLTRVWIADLASLPRKGGRRATPNRVRLPLLTQEARQMQEARPECSSSKAPRRNCTTTRRKTSSPSLSLRRRASTITSCSARSTSSN